MAILEVRKRYVGTFAGFMWTIINPLMIILVFWFVFSVGFKVQPVGGVGFTVIFFCGFIPWTTFSETLLANTSSITGNPHLVKKMVFPTEILPLVNLVAGCISHIAMLLVLAVVLVSQHISFSIFNLQFLYYFFGMVILSLGLGWLCAAINVFFRDVGQIVGVLLNMWFWLTPIVWVAEMIPKKYHYVLKLNPMYYIVDGYKSSFVYHEPIWRQPLWSAYFWSFAFLSFLIGGYIFKKVKSDFADVL